MPGMCLELGAIERGRHLVTAASWEGTMIHWELSPPPVDLSLPLVLLRAKGFLETSSISEG